MAGAGHGAGFAVAAIAHHGLALLFLFYHAYDYRRDYSEQYGAYDDSADVLCYPCHVISSFFVSGKWQVVSGEWLAV